MGMSTQTKNKALTILRSRGIVKVVVEFSGGNDEGGADSSIGYLADGTEVELDGGNAFQTQRYDHTTKSYGKREWMVWTNIDGKHGERPATEAEIAVSELTQIIEEPIYDLYGSFAGDFYVNGTLVWDVTAGTVTMDRDEEERNWVHSSEEY